MCENFENTLEQTCQDFSRFYFLDRDELIETIGQIRDCRKYIKTVRLCFPGIHELVYALPSSAIKDVAAAASTTKNAKIDDSIQNELNFDIHGKSRRVKVTQNNKT
jgi:hypothetical protein